MLAAHSHGVDDERSRIVRLFDVVGDVIGEFQREATTHENRLEAFHHNGKRAS